MNYTPPPRPPFNDALYQALNPLQQVMQDKVKLDQIKAKYGVQKPPPPPPIQWKGDNNG